MSLVIAINSLGVNAKSNKLCEKSKSQNSIIQAIKNKKIVKFLTGEIDDDNEEVEK